MASRIRCSSTLLKIITNSRPNLFSNSFCKSLSIDCRQLIVEEYGDPVKVVKLTTETIGNPEPGQVVVKILAAPVNPSDINTIQGTYAVKPPLPMVSGNEGVGEVVAVADQVEELKVGDRVIPKINAMGTWRTHIINYADDFIKIPKDIPIVSAATAAVNPASAYRMLRDFVQLGAGDTVVQNGANSAVGQAAIQIAAAMGARTINVVRDRPNIAELKDYLKSLGATVVVTEQEVRNNPEIKKLPKPRLAFNCTSGSSATEILRLLEDNGTMVTYGGMSRQPIKVPVGALIFNNVTLKGFWMTRWNKVHLNHEKRQNMLDNIFALIRQGVLKPPVHNIVKFDDYKTALEKAMPFEGKVGAKQILLMDEVE